VAAWVGERREILTLLALPGPDVWLSRRGVLQEAASGIQAQ